MIDCNEHQTFMYISPMGHQDHCYSDPDSISNLQILFSDQCQALTYDQLVRADALIGLTAGDTSTEI